MPRLSDYVRSAEEAAVQQKGGGDKGSSTRPAAKAALSPPPPPPLAPTTTTTPATTTPNLNLPRYRDRATGRLLPKGSLPPPRPRAHVQARREWRGLVRYCCAAVSKAAGAGAVPLPPDAGEKEEEEEEGGGKTEDDDQVSALEDPEAPWGEHYAALLKGVGRAAAG